MEQNNQIARQTVQNTEVQLTFEQALERLEWIVGQLETGQSTLENSMKLFEEGMKLNAFCGAKLAEAEKKLEKLVKKEDGTLVWEQQ